MRWNKWLKEVDSTDPLELWELDVKEMFPNLHREDFSQRSQDFALRVQKERKKRAKEPFFAIDKIDRKMDCMGTVPGVRRVLFMQVYDYAGSPCVL